ncbi:O-antigen ligase family protein [Psychroserpens mesophilus]|uniref:O-antigen ligase family protein n=1 Tax=Psychroserpens mesophilus TaxID=325473 RepID=UPI0005910CE8|nr:O-antigen ligase family protein [Psychroserpens mesophilus]
MILIPFLIFLAMILARTQKGMFACLLIMVATKSIIDAYWDYRFGPLTIMSIQGALTPVLFYKIFYSRKMFPSIWLSTAKIHFAALTLGVVWALASNPVPSAEIVALNLNIFLAFFLIPLLVTDKARLKQLLIAVMICGIFPMAVSLFQLQTGVIFRERTTVGLSRYVGFYHDGFPVRFYGLMSIFAVLVYQSVFKTNNPYFKAFLIALAGGASISVYLAFSKAAVGIVVLWVILILFFSKTKLKQAVPILIGFSILMLAFGNVVFDNIEQLFSKETGYQTGEVKDARYTLAGRGYIWEHYWDQWLNHQSMFFQWFGDGINRPVHNEFFRVLVINGIIGLVLLIFFIFRMLKHIFQINSHIRVFGMMLFGMYFFDCIGLVPGSYYYYNILVWGFFGLLLLRPHLFMKQQQHI